MMRPAARLRPVLKTRTSRTHSFFLSTTSAARFAYPKEGVFQQNSPPNELLNRQSVPQQQQGQTQSPYPGYLNPEIVHQQYAPPPPPPRSRLWKYAGWAALLTAGVASGISGYVYIIDACLQLVPWPLTPDTPEDHEQLQLLALEYESLALVQQLRQQWHDKDGEQVRTWKEWVAYQGLWDNVERGSQRLTTGPLKGSQGVAAQSVFWNEQTRELLLFINFGEAMTGWPGVVHGGIIATICDEGLGRVAIRTADSKTGVTAHLEINYLDKCVPGQWYVLYAQPDTTKISTGRKKFVVGSLSCAHEWGPLKNELPSSGHVHAQAAGLFVVPKSLAVSEIEDEF